MTMAVSMGAGPLVAKENGNAAKKYTRALTNLAQGKKDDHG